MESKMVMLAISMKPGGRCIAGIDIKTGRWVRPVSVGSNRAAPNSLTIQRLKILDIVTIQLSGDRPIPPDKYQIENMYVQSWNLRPTGSYAAPSILEFCEDDKVILHSHTDRVDPDYLETLPENQWKSLQLVRTEVSFVRDEWQEQRWRANFRDGSGHYLSLKITDPGICEKLNNGEEIARTCVLTISLPGPWAPPDGSQPKRCYKLVAGVVEMR